MIRCCSIFVLLAATACIAVDAQSWSVGDGMATYQILFANWRNPNGLTYTGQRCDQIGSKCDTQFNGDFEIFGCNATEQRRMSRLTWPGPTDVSQWRRIGKRKYDPNSLTDFAYVNLTGVDCSDFCGIIVRLEVLDVDPLHNDLIDKYIGTLPGCQDLQVARYESQAQFSLPVAMESISIALPQVPRHHKPNMDTIQQHQLHLKVRAWGGPPTSPTGTSSRSSSPYAPSSSGSTRNTQQAYTPFNTGGTSSYNSQTVYGTRYNRTRYQTQPPSSPYNPNYDSGASDYTTTESSLYGANRYSQTGTSFGGSASNYDRHGYPPSSSRRTYSSGINP